MIYNQILVRFGDLTLKGKNQRDFLHRLYDLVALKMQGLKVTIENTHDRIYIHLNGEEVAEVQRRLEYVSGISSYSLVVRCENDLQIMKQTALELMKEIVSKETTFKVETKRSNKNYPLHSMEVTKQIAGYVLANHNLLRVDVHHPEVTLHVELKGNACYLYNAEYRAMGGYPVGVAGKGLLMLSGGIDSPVAGYLAMKQGIEIECVHFESTPLTSIESAQKVMDLVKIMARYAPKNKINLHMVPFKELHMALLEHIPESYTITIMRRMMYRIAEQVCHQHNCKIIINGESIGQVASQTLDSMVVINAVTNLPVIRPVACMDKLEIIEISKKIDTYETSILPYEDCCTIFLPKHPVIYPTMEKAISYENLFNFQALIQEAIENVETITQLDETKSNYL